MILTIIIDLISINFISMHLIYRSKKQAQPIVNDLKLAPYYPQITHSPTHTASLFSRKKSIDVILDKHKNQNATINDQILIYQKPQRKTSYPYRPQRTRKAESGYLKNTHKIDTSENKLLTRNQSTQLNQKPELWLRKKGDSEYSPYLINQYKKTRSNSKFKATQQTPDHPIQRDWICEKFIENEVYAVQQSNDFI